MTTPEGAWSDGSLSSPETGRPLYRSRSVLTDESGAELWPVVEEIPYLRTGRTELRERACGLLESGEKEAALTELLRDQDDWAPNPPPERPEVAAAIGAANSGRPAREVMLALGFGSVADYFEHRLSDPTYLAGLVLVEEHWNAPQTAFELACGVGHYTRELRRRGVDAAAGDVVFAKLWLARRYVAPQARLVCFDASGPFPVGEASADLVLCQDAFYFLPEKEHVASELRRVAGIQGTVLVGHSHNPAVGNHSAGDPVTPSRHTELFPGSVLYADEELTKAIFSGDRPEPKSPDHLHDTEAVCVASAGARSRNGMPEPDLLLPPPGTPLYPNPLYRHAGEETLVLDWPSRRYREEYGPRSRYLPKEAEASDDLLRLAADRGAGTDLEVDRLARSRVLVDLPEGW